MIEAIEKAVFYHKTEENKSSAKNQFQFELYKQIESLPSLVRQEIIDQSAMSRSLKQDFDTKYNQLAIIKRDFLLIEVLDEINIKPEEEQEKILREHHVTRQEYQYIQSLLSENFVMTEVASKKQGKGLTYQKALYYNGPIK